VLSAQVRRIVVIVDEDSGVAGDDFVGVQAVDGEVVGGGGLVVGAN
jgi:hypothetical protein